MSNSIFDSWYPAHLATLKRERSVPRPPLGYGRDIRNVISADGVLDVDPMRREVDPQDTKAIFDSLCRRFWTVRGKLRRHLDYGTSVIQFLNSPATISKVQNIQTVLRKEALKDERVQAADITVTIGAGRIDIKCLITRHDQGDTFQFTFGVDGSGRLTAVLLS